MDEARATMKSGQQFEIAHGDYAASIASIGGSLRTLTHRGRDLVVPFEANEARPFFRGAVLAPWPNRVVDGRYSFNDLEQQLPITEPDRNHALHGLVYDSDFELVASSAAWVTLRTTIVAQPGYPHKIDLLVTYSVDDEGLRQVVAATNAGETTAPFGTGGHPYLVAGPGRVDDWTLTLPADVILEVDERLSPVAAVAVNDPEHGDYDYRSPRMIGDQFIDNAFTDLHFVNGITTVTLMASNGEGVAMSWGEECQWTQIHTADQPDPTVDRIGLVVEALTSPPDAFNSGIDLIVLEPGESTTASWTISALP